LLKKLKKKVKMDKEVKTEKVDTKKREFIKRAIAGGAIFGAGLLSGSLLERAIAQSEQQHIFVGRAEDGQPLFLVKGERQYLNLEGDVIVQKNVDVYNKPVPMVIGKSGEVLVDSTGKIVNPKAGEVGTYTQTNGLQEAINYLNTTGGGLIVVKEGTYTVNYQIPNNTLQYPVMLVGKGRATLIQPNGNFEPIDFNKIQVRDIVYKNAQLLNTDITMANISLTKVKQFFWNVGDRRNVERGIDGYYNADTTAVSTNSATRVTLKTYTFTSSARTNKIRVRVYARVSNYTSGSTLYLNINGSDVVTVTVTNTTSTLKIDYIGDISSNTSITVKVDGVAESGFTLFVDRVYVIAGLGLTSTTPVNILTINQNSIYDLFNLKVDGNFGYKLRWKWNVRGNKKTTTNVSITANLANKWESLWSGSGDDGDNITVIAIGLGDFTSSFTISGNVGASGDVLIITEIFAQVDITGRAGWEGVSIREDGIAFIHVRFITLVGGIEADFSIAYQHPTGGVVLYNASTTQYLTTFVQAVCNTKGVNFGIPFIDTHSIPPTKMLGFIDYLNIIVIGI
jgi:hypothetical protein